MSRLLVALATGAALGLAAPALAQDMGGMSMPGMKMPKPATKPATKKPAARKQFFGQSSRFAVAPVHTRFDAVEWFVWDASLTMDNELTPVIRQASTLEKAVRGLPVDDDE